MELVKWTGDSRHCDDVFSHVMIHVCADDGYIIGRSPAGHLHYPFNFTGLELVGVSGDSASMLGGRRRGFTLDCAQCLFSGLTVSDC